MVRSTSWCPQFGAMVDTVLLFWFSDVSLSISIEVAQAQSATTDSLHSLMGLHPAGTCRGASAEDSPGGLVLVGGCGKSTLTFRAIHEIASEITSSLLLLGGSREVTFLFGPPQTS